MASLIIQHTEVVDGSERRFGYGTTYDGLGTDELAARIAQRSYTAKPDIVDRTVTVELGTLTAEEASLIHQELRDCASGKPVAMTS